MVAYSDAVLALPGLVAYWPLVDAAGSLTGADLGPSALTLTYAQAKVDAPEQVSGLGAGMLGDGTARRASRAVGAGTPLQLAAGVSLGMWYTPTTTPAGGFRSIGGRSANWQLRHVAGGAVSAVATITGATGTLNPTSAARLVNGVASFVGMSWDGSELVLWINGVRDNAGQRVGGTLPTTTDAMEILSVGAANFADGAVSGALVANRALTAGEWRALYLAGTKVTPPVEGRSYDLTFRSPAVAASALQATGCATCGGQMRVGEPRINTGAANGRGIHHPGCYGARRVGRPQTVLGSASTADQVGTETTRWLHDQVMTWCRRPAANTIRYFDGSQYVTTDATDEYFTVAPHLALGCAALGHLAGASPDHWTATIGRKLFDQALTVQQPNGLLVFSAGPDHHFSMFSLLPARLLLGRVVDRRTLDGWDAALLAAGEYLLTGNTPPESQWYTNGNVELYEAGIYWLLWRLTGQQRWYDQYETQLAFAESPPQDGSGAGFGLVTVQAPALTDGSDGRAYFAEKGTAAPGLDWNYLAVQVGVLTSLRQFGNTEARVLRWLNMLHNQLMTRVNTTTWQFDATGGTRQSYTGNFQTASPAALSLSGLRADVPTTWPGAQWAVASPDFRAYRESSSRIDKTLEIARWVMSTPAWPGMPS